MEDDRRDLGDSISPMLRASLEDLMRALSPILGRAMLESELLRIKQSRFPVLTFSRFLNTHGRTFHIERTFLSRILRNFPVLLKLWSPRALPIELRGDRQFTEPFYRLVDHPSSSLSILDFLHVIQARHFLTDAQFRELCAAVTWTSEPHPADVFGFLDVAVTIGLGTPEKVGSYTRVDYPLGYPPNSGQHPGDAGIMNRNWISCESESGDSCNKAPSSISQVDDQLEKNENDNSFLDIEIARNATVLRLFLHHGPVTAYPSPIVQNEMEAVYGPSGPLILSLLRENPLIVYDRIMRRLRERTVALRVQKIRMQRAWTLELERTLPRHAAKYEDVRLGGPLPVFGPAPIGFRIEITYLLLSFFDVVTEFGKGRGAQIAREMVAELRGDREIVCSFAHAVALCCAATFCQMIEPFLAADQRVAIRRQIPIEIGFTAKERHGIPRLFRVIVEAFTKKKWSEGTQEIVGLFEDVGLKQALDLIKMGQILVKWSALWAADAGDVDLVRCVIEGGLITLTSPGDSSLSVRLDLTKGE
jgi:hypothetical protein